MTERSISRKADYQRMNDATTTLIEKAVPAYSKQLHMDMIQECMSAVDGAEKLGLLDTKQSSDLDSPFLKPWTIRNAHGEPAYYTMKFSGPMIYHIPPLLGHLKIRLNVYPGRIAEYVPCYTMNLNRVVLAKFDPPYYDNIGNGILGQFVLQSGKRMRLSSANVFMPGGAQHRPLQHGGNVARMYFEHYWWHFPMARGMLDMSCMHNLVYHSHSRVKQVVRLRKTLLRVLKIGRRDSRIIINSEKPVDCIHVRVSLLVDNGMTLLPEKRWILARGSMASFIKEGSILNVVLVEPDIAQPNICVMMGHVGSPMQFADKSILSVAVSIASWSVMRDAGPESSLTRLGRVDEIVERVAKIIDNNSAPDSVLHIPWRFRQGDIKSVIDDFCPLYVRTKGEVFHTPPPVASFVLSTQPPLLNSRSAVGIIARMFGLVEPTVKKWKLDTVMSLIAGGKRTTSATFLDTLLTQVPRLAGESALFRMLHFQP